METKDQTAIKAAFRRLVKDSGGVEAVASFTRACKSVISDGQNRNKKESFPAVDTIFDVEDYLDDPAVTRLLARMHGYDLVPNEAAQEDEMVCLLRMAVEGDAASGEFSAAVLKARTDGHIDNHELDVLIELSDKSAALRTGHGDALRRKRERRNQRRDLRAV